MLLFFLGFFIIFFIVFIIVVVLSIINILKIRKRNYELIKKFKVNGKLYLIYLKFNYNRYYNN